MKLSNASFTHGEFVSILAVHACPSEVSSNNSYSHVISPSSSGISSPFKSWISTFISAILIINFWIGVILSISSLVSGSTHASRALIIASGWSETASNARLCKIFWIDWNGNWLFARLSIDSCKASHSLLPTSALYAASKSPVPSNLVKFSIGSNICA